MKQSLAEYVKLMESMLITLFILKNTFATKGENSPAIQDIIYKNVEIGSTIHTDEHNGYDVFHAHFVMQRVNHTIEYMGLNGECNNQAESYNARFRRIQHGQYHKVDTLYLSNYANEIAYREDTRRWSNCKIFNNILTKCLRSNVSNEFCGYWQGE